MLGDAGAAPPQQTRRAVVRYESEPRVMQQEPEQRGVRSGEHHSVSARHPSERPGAVATAADEPGRAEALVAPLVALVAFALYALTASPALGWLDAPEFAAAAASLGVSHSPGHPLVALVGLVYAAPNLFGDDPAVQIARDDGWKNHAPGALYFHARYVSPNWRKTRIAQIDNHIFYR